MSENGRRKGIQIASSADVFEVLAQGQRVGSLRRSLSAITRQLFTDMTTSMQERVVAVNEDGLSEDRAKRQAAWNGVLESTVTLTSAHESLAQVVSLERRAQGMLDEVTSKAALLIELAERDLPETILPETLKAELEPVAAGDTDPGRFARSILGLTRPENHAAMAQSLQWMTGLRLQALHATLLGELADATPSSGAASEADLESLSRDVSEKVTALRDAARAGAKELADETASPAFALSLWAALFEFETWLLTDVPSALAAACAAATGRVDNDDADAERWARETGKTYDTLRQGLAYDAGVRAVLLAYASYDDRKLAAFAEARDLPVESATVDLPRSSLSAVAEAPEGEAIEIAGLVSDASFTVGGPSNRSVLSLGPSGAVRVLVPHVAASSFGIDTGVWTQVRGRAHPTGKDGIDGPVVLAGRIQRKDAAQHSFTDALIFTGRHSFDVRPSDLDLVASRVAGNRTTLNEIGMRRLKVRS
jgi:hypothetical protein